MAPTAPSAAASLEARVDALAGRLRARFEVQSGYKDPRAQARLVARHFRDFDRDRSGVVDFDEFTRAMHRLNVIGAQAEVEGLFDRFDEDLNGVISYDEFARGLYGIDGAAGGRLGLGPEATTLLGRIKARLLAAGGKNGLRTLTVLLRRMDLNGNGVLEPHELRAGLDAVLGLDKHHREPHGYDDGADEEDGGEDELDRVFRYFDRDGSGKITVDELLRGLRGSMPKRRVKLVQAAFARLDTSGDGRVTLDEVERLYDPSHHPEVLAGRLRPRDALLEFMRVFEDASSRDGVITWAEFLQYYKDLSAGMASDDEFELMIRNAWHLSGGAGWCANSANRRVLVTFADGAQRVVEIEDDLGIGARDTRRMRERLTAQGLRGIVDISLAH